MAFYSIEPFGGIHDEIRSARTCASIYAAQGDSRKIAEFMIRPYAEEFGGCQETQTDAEIERALDMLVAQTGVNNGKLG